MHTLPMVRRLVCVAVGVVVLMAAMAYGRTPRWGGLSAVAVSPDGKMIVTAGNSRTLYVLDAGTLQVKDRLWLGVRVGSLAFSKDGSRLVMEDEDDVLHFLDAATWKETSKIEKAGLSACSLDADLVAVRSYDYKNTEIRFLSMRDGAVKGKVAVVGKVSSLGLSKDGAKLVVLTEAKDVAKDVEPKAAYADIPKDLKGLDRTTFEQKNDGKTCQMLTFEVASGKQVSQLPMWYTAAEDSLVAVGADATYVVPYSNACAKISADGATVLFAMGSGYNYGAGMSEDRAKVIGGGLRDGAVATTKDLQQAKFSLDRLPGWPEYFERFAFAPDGCAYGVTTANRLMKLNAAGSVEKIVPVY